MAEEEELHLTDDFYVITSAQRGKSKPKPERLFVIFSCCGKVPRPKSGSKCQVSCVCIRANKFHFLLSNLADKRFYLHQFMSTKTLYSFVMRKR